MESAPTNRQTLSPRQRQQHLMRRGGAAVLCALMVAMFQLYDGEGQGFLPGYHWRMVVAIDTAELGGLSGTVEVPLEVNLSHADLRWEAHGGKVAQQNGADINFTAGNGATLLAHELLDFDPKRGVLRARVLIDTLHRDIPTHLFVYFGNDARREPIRHHLSTAPTAAGKPGRGPADSYLRRDRPSMAVELIPGEVEAPRYPYPVKFRFTEVNVKGGNLVLVEWATDREEDNDYFAVQRSQDGRRFEELGVMGGSNETDDYLRYSFADQSPLEGPAYYRVVQVNNNGDYSYSGVIPFYFNPNLRGLEVQQAGPSPFRDEIEVTFSTGKAGAIEIVLFSADGSMLANDRIDVSPGQHQHHLRQLGDLPAGTYVLSVTGPDRKPQVLQLEKGG